MNEHEISTMLRIPYLFHTLCVLVSYFGGKYVSYLWIYPCIYPVSRPVPFEQEMKISRPVFEGTGNGGPAHPCLGGVALEKKIPQITLEWSGLGLDQV